VTMPERHPYEHDLLAYVEDELADAERDSVRRHLETCSACAAEVADAEAGRALLQAAPTFELASQRRAEILAGLRPPPRRRSSWRLVLVTAAALLAAVALAFAALDGGFGSGSDDQAATGASADSGGQQEEGAAGPDLQYRLLLGSVKGPARDVARELRRDGLDARVEDGAVVVRAKASDADAERSANGFERGPVEIYLEIEDD